MRAISFYWTLNPVETALWNSNCEDVGTQDPVLRPSTHHKQRSWSTSMVQDIGDSQLVNGINRSLAILSTAPLLNLQRCQLWWTLPCFSRDEEPFKTRQLDWQRQKEAKKQRYKASSFILSAVSVVILSPAPIDCIMKVYGCRPSSVSVSFRLLSWNLQPNRILLATRHVYDPSGTHAMG